MPLLIDSRIAFGQTVQLKGPSAMVTAEVFGGPIIALQVAVFDRLDNIIDGVGFDGFGETLTSEGDGSARWLFQPLVGASYIKWGIIAIRSAAGLGRYSVTAKLRDDNGDSLVSGRFSGEIPDGRLNDDVVYDGVMVSTVKATVLPKGPAT